MFTLDGSENSWLVYADWLEDQDIDARHIREPLFVNNWRYEYRSGAGVGSVSVVVGYVGGVGVVGSVGYVGGGFGDGVGGFGSVGGN